MRRALVALCAVLLAGACQGEVWIDDSCCLGPRAPISLRVKADGSILWNGEKIDKAELNQRLAIESKKNTTPEIHLEPDRDSKYPDVSAVMEALQRAGLANKMGVIGGT